MNKLNQLVGQFVVGTALISSSGLAQQPVPPGPVGAGNVPGNIPGAIPVPSPATAADVDISVGQKPTLTVEEMINQSRQYQQGMGQVIQRIQTLQETARKQKDIIKLNCVSDKLVQAKVNASIADQAMTSLQENVAKSDEGGRTHEFTRLTIINQKVTVLGAEAENCIGEDLTFVGATRIDVDINPNIPRDDPTQPGSPVLDVQRPPAASIFK